ncbi:hypothetical protein PILCRDRAFT_435539 [Piloderma croceum F 1598]|uniref:Uncharacterized protein n=1 Tax=Piloderma croceum (strain F 1598) TaxID=765440 RepID=A0A0C3FYB2_PILCF|nr:hypothetical protein PILCRDRAFT_435539 [Piloderma croceum F 1598]
MLSFSLSFVLLVGLEGIILLSKQVNLNVSCVIICKLCTILFSPGTLSLNLVARGASRTL